MDDGLTNKSNLEIEKIWADKQNPQNSKEFIQIVHQEMISRGLIVIKKDPIDEKLSKKFKRKMNILIIEIVLSLFIALALAAASHDLGMKNYALIISAVLILPTMYFGFAYQNLKCPKCGEPFNYNVHGKPYSEMQKSAKGFLGRRCGNCGFEV